MLNRFLKVLVVSASLLLLQEGARAADITVHDVYAKAQAGQVSEALSMMDQVLRDHPNSGQAHFVNAELLARSGQLEAARTEYSTAKRLSPGLPFARPAAVQALQSQLYGSSPVRVQSEASHGIPFGAIIMVGLLILSVVLFVRAMRGRAAIQAQGTAFGNAPPAGYGPGYGQGGGLGGGILGGLATGAALGAGMVAGEALASKLMDGHEGHVPDATPNPDVNHDMGGSDFGLSDSSWDAGSGGDFGGDIGGGDWS